MNFRSIIIPEALKTIQAEEESVCIALKCLNEMITDAGCPLEQLAHQVEILHRNKVMGIEVSLCFHPLITITLCNICNSTVLVTC